MKITQVTLSLYRICTVRRIFLIVGKVLHSIKFVLFERVPVRVKALCRVTINRFDFLIYNPLFHLGKIIVDGILGRETVVAVSYNMSNLALKTPDGFLCKGYRFYSTNTKLSAESSQLHWNIKIDKDNPDIFHFTHSDGRQLTLTYDFIEWFRGFTDAEGCFYFNRIADKFTFSFGFRIVLHIDDLAALEFIQNSLQIGKVRRNKIHPTAEYYVSSVKDLPIIIAIFSKFNLNSTKHLNFIGFKEAFMLVMSNKNVKDIDTQEVILNQVSIIKGSMNNLRDDITMPSQHSIIITPYWLLGFCEGDGSFNYIISKGAICFSISQKDSEALMGAIKDFLILLLPEEHSPEDMNTVNIYSAPFRASILEVRSSLFIGLVIIPLFDSLTWHTKKSLDFHDWKLIFELRKLGHHYSEEGKTLINQIQGQMNNNRLSSTSSSGKNFKNREQLLAEATKLLSGVANYEFKAGNRIWIKSLNKFKSDTSAKIVNLVDKSTGAVLISFTSQTSCAQKLGISEGGVRQRIKLEREFKYEGKIVYLIKS